MAAPNNQFIAVVINGTGDVEGDPQYFTTQALAAAGAKNMIRNASHGCSVYVYKVFAHIDMTVTYDVVID